METKSKSGPIDKKTSTINKITGKVMTEEEIDKILEEKRNADFCETQFPDCPPKPNNSSCLTCPLYKKYK
jgi:hypothetical protein